MNFNEIKKTETPQLVKMNNVQADTNDKITPEPTKSHKINKTEILKTIRGEIDALQRPEASNKYAPVELNIKRWEALNKNINKLVACSKEVTLEEFEEVLSYQGGYLQSLVNKGYYRDLANVREDKRAALENEKLESEWSHSGDHDANNVQADTNDNITPEPTELHFVDNHFAFSQADTNDNITPELTELYFVDNHFASSSDNNEEGFEILEPETKPLTEATETSTPAIGEQHDAAVDGLLNS